MPLESEQLPADGKGSVRENREKSKNAFRTISEVAKELGLPQHVLRFWETKFPQVSPMKRGGGRRYYRPEDVVILARIRSLLHDEGYTIKGVQKLLKKSGSILSDEFMQKHHVIDDDAPDTLAEKTTEPAIIAQSATAEDKGIFSGLRRDDAKKLLAELVSVRESLKKYS